MLELADASWMNSEMKELHEVATHFFTKEGLPHLEKWEQQGFVDKEAWRKAGEVGLLCPTIPEEYGGQGGSFLHLAAILDATVRTLVGNNWGHIVHHIAADYILRHGSEEQRQRWLPQMVAGELLGAIAMTEPGAGSDLKTISTKARLDGDEFVVDGSKTFITNGSIADIVILVAKTDPSAGARGISLFVVDTRGLRGFSRGRPLAKVGQHSNNTTELFFDNVRIPADCLLGELGGGFGLLMEGLVEERLLVGVQALAAIEEAMRYTVDYTKNRQLFGGPHLALQNTRFVLAECATLSHVGRTFLNTCIDKHLAGQLDATTAAMAKWWLTDIQCDIIDRCVQLFGGYGYMLEYPIARLYADARIQKIYGGANEVMKELIARQL